MPSCPKCQARFDDGRFCPVDGEPLVGDAAYEEDRVGQAIAGRYRLLRKVGEGAMGEVYAAEHCFIRKRLAVKLLRREWAADGEAVQRLRREAHAASAIGHPNIVHVEDFGYAEDGTVYLAMEWLEGPTLSEAMAEAMDLGHAVGIVGQVCAGLSAAHRAGVVHRDVKPANILLTRADSASVCAKILDFGVAKVLLPDGVGELTQQGSFVGTPFYVSPEQALGQPVDHRTDIYAIGVILYELLTGDVPFRSSSSLDVLARHIADVPEPPSRRRPGLPPSTDRVVMRCLSKRPEERYDSAEQLAAELPGLLPAGSGPVAAVRSARLAKRSRRLAIRVVPALIAVGGLIAWVFLRGPLKSSPSAPSDPTEWPYSGRTEAFAYRIALAPSRSLPGKPAVVTFDVQAIEHHLQDHISLGEVTGVLEFVDARDPKDSFKFRGSVSKTGRLVQPQVTGFDRSGTYRVAVVLEADERTLGEARFSICIGADPRDGPRALAAVCPEMMAAADDRR